MATVHGSGVAAPGERRGWFHRFAHAPWWVHVIATLAAASVLLAIAAAVAAALFVDFVRQHPALHAELARQAVVPDAEALAIAQRFAPVLRYDSRELFVPILRSAYLSRAELRKQDGHTVSTLSRSVTESSLPTARGSCEAACFLFLDLRGAEPDPPSHSERKYGAIEKELIRTGAKPTVYYHVTRYEDTGDYAVQYWFLYLFNYRLNEHESDWEQITLRLDADRQPIDAFYSAHEGGHTLDWSQLRTDGDHPFDFPARGSHANYPDAGHHRLSVACKRILGSLEQCIRGRKLLVDVSDGKGAALEPGKYDLAELTGPVFAGSYGSGNYIVVTRKRDVLADPRARSAWRDPLRPFD